ncbi:hypothetical protein [Domibacillus tundrae]|nr:hypothetical protein [Domibacillus tundrae]
MQFSEGDWVIVESGGGTTSWDFSIRRKLLEQAIGQGVTVIEYKQGERRQ